MKEEIQEIRQKKFYRLRAAQDMWHGGIAKVGLPVMLAKLVQLARLTMVRGN